MEVSHARHRPSIFSYTNEVIWNYAYSPFKSFNLWKYGFTRDKAERKSLKELQMIWEGGEPGDLEQEYS